MQSKKSDDSKSEPISLRIGWVFLITAGLIMLTLILVRAFTPFEIRTEEGNDLSGWVSLVISAGIGISIAIAIYRYSTYIRTKTEKIIEEQDEERKQRKKYVVTSIRGYLTELKEYLVRVEESVAEFNKMPEPKKGAEHAPEWTDFTKSNFTNANFQDAMLTYAILAKTDLKDANLDGAGTWATNLNDCHNHPICE